MRLGGARRWYLAIAQVSIDWPSLKPGPTYGDSALHRKGNQPLLVPPPRALPPQAEGRSLCRSILARPIRAWSRPANRTLTPPAQLSESLPMRLDNRRDPLAVANASPSYDRLCHER